MVCLDNPLPIPDHRGLICIGEGGLLLSGIDVRATVLDAENKNEVSLILVNSSPKAKTVRANKILANVYSAARDNAALVRRTAPDFTSGDWTPDQASN